MKAVVIDYTNWRGERRNRRVRPYPNLVFGPTEWHPVPQWHLHARDLDLDEDRLFAMKDIHSWRACDDKEIVEQTLADTKNP